MQSLASVCMCVVIAITNGLIAEEKINFLVMFIVSLTPKPRLSKLTSTFNYIIL